MKLSLKTQQDWMLYQQVMKKVTVKINSIQSQRLDFAICNTANGSIQLTITVF